MAVGAVGIKSGAMRNESSEGRTYKKQGQSLRSRKAGDDLSYTGHVNPGFVAAKWPTASARRVVVVIGYAS
jgi:hypothetical protein